MSNTITPENKRPLSPKTCDEMSSKHIALQKSLTKESESSPSQAQAVGNSNVLLESENRRKPLGKSDTGLANVTVVNQTAFSTDSPSTSASKYHFGKDFKQPEVVKSISKPEIILQIGTDYASDGELDDSPLPDLPETSPISDKSEMSPTTRELLTKSDSDEKDVTKTNDNNSVNISDGNLYEDSNKSEEIPSIKNGSPKSGGIQLVNFQLKSYTLPDTERFGGCRLITEFQKLSVIGEGAFGIVYKVLDKKNNNQVLALKKLKLKINTEDSLPIQVVREINILKTLEHPNIVNSHGVAVGCNFNNTYLILDFCECDLSKIIDDEKSSVMLQEREIKCIMLQLFEGLKYIHFNYVIHRDLSCLNVLFTSRGVLKIGDFGSSRNVMPNVRMTPNIVSRWYRAPELLLGETMYTSAIDIWSSGCILAEAHLKRPLLKATSDTGMIAGIIDLLGTPTERTWRGISQLPVLQNFDLIEQPDNRLRIKFQDMSLVILSLLERLLTYDPLRRITAADALNHPCFQLPPTACGPEGLIPILNVAEEVVRLRGR